MIFAITDFAGTGEQVVTPLTDVINRIVPNIPSAILILLVGVLSIRILSHLIQFGLKLTRMPAALVEITVKLIDIALWVFLGIACLQFLGLNNVALAVSGSFAFVVLGLSQGGAATVADVLAGIALARDRDFSVGDHIKLIDKPIDGIVEHMDLRRTRIRSEDNKRYIVSNSTIDKVGWILVQRRREIAEAHQKKTLIRRKGTT